jgi:hypothetical protein
MPSLRDQSNQMSSIKYDYQNHNQTYIYNRITQTVHFFFLKWDVLGLNLGPCIYNAMSLPTEAKLTGTKAHPIYLYHLWLFFFLNGLAHTIAPTKN